MLNFYQPVTQHLTKWIRKAIWNEVERVSFKNVALLLRSYLDKLPDLSAYFLYQ